MHRKHLLMWRFVIGDIFDLGFEKLFEFTWMLNWLKKQFQQVSSSILCKEVLLRMVSIQEADFQFGSLVAGI